MSLSQHLINEELTFVSKFNFDKLPYLNNDKLKLKKNNFKIVLASINFFTRSKHL